jgi:hypothetical protein
MHKIVLKAYEARVATISKDYSPANFERRRLFIEDFGWGVPTSEGMNELADLIKTWPEAKCLSIGCGSAFVEATLSALTGIEILCTDHDTPSHLHVPVEQFEQIRADDASKKYCETYQSVAYVWESVFLFAITTSNINGFPSSKEPYKTYSYPLWCAIS